MEINQQLLEKIKRTVEKPILVGAMLPICVAQDPCLVITLYRDPDIARLAIRYIASLVAFFTSISEEFTNCLVQELYLELAQRVEARMEQNFYHGCIVGLLRGFCDAALTESAQKQLGDTFSQLLQFDRSSEEELYKDGVRGELANTIAGVSGKHPFFVSSFLEISWNAVANGLTMGWFQGAYAKRVLECFQHNVISLPELTLADTLPVLKKLHDEALRRIDGRQ